MTDLFEAFFKHGSDVMLNRTRMLLILLDGNGHILEANSGWQLLKRSFPTAEQVFDVLIDESRADFMQAVTMCLDSQEVVQTSLSAKAFDNQINQSFNGWFIPLEDKQIFFIGELLPTLDKKLDPDFIKLQRQLMVSSQQIADLKKTLAGKQEEISAMRNEIEKVSQMDRLTQLPNRLSILVYFEQQVKISRRYKADLALFIMNFDSFKRINDAYGYSAGDSVLKQSVDILNRTIRGSDFLGRYSGDEFIGILPETAVKEAEILSNRIRQYIEKMHFEIENADPIRATVRFGVAQFDPEFDVTDGLLWRKNSLLWRADAALLEAKEQGGNLVVVK